MPAALTDDDKAFIRAILDHPEELTTWLVYADWLDDRDDPRSEFLRLSVERRQLAALDPVGKEIDAQLAVLRDRLDPNWMLVFDSARLANCRGPGWLFRCPMTWDSLTPTDEPDIRICHACKSPVFYCHTAEEARQFASCGQCVALSSRIAEIPAELEVITTVGIMRHPDDEEGEEATLESRQPPPPRRPWWKFW